MHKMNNEAPDAQIFPLGDPHHKHTRHFKLPEYHAAASGVYDSQRHEYLLAVRELVAPFMEHVETEQYGQWILNYAKQLEEQGQPYDTIVSETQAAAAHYWNILNGSTEN